MVGAVAKVAALAAVTEDEPKPKDSNDASDNLLGYYNNFSTATGYLLSKAQSVTQTAPVDDEMSDSATSTTTTNSMSGIWTNPAPLLDNGDPSAEMYTDMTKFLAASDVPATFVQSDGSVVDTAKAISTVIFADQPVPPPDGAADAFDVQAPFFHFQNADKSLAIKGCHAYYALPLGKTGPDFAWHGCVNVAATTNQSFRTEYEAQKRSLHVFNAVQLGGTADVWLVTMQVLWAAAPLAMAAFPIFQDLWNKQYGTYIVIMDTVVGSVQTVKIQCPANITPAQVRSAVDRIAQDAATQLAGGAPKLNASQALVVTGPPPAQVTDSTLIVVNSSNSVA